ncbi:uncharacterized protein LOC126313349 [Schistocerca gregaria]|uniref:uncharacterized protein LOC126313349 n=1 Tax=Schistocerca gregaria TaxID=7010 RepID=UPI00211ED82B|nr:uncharacterized protein LOC126313349 [Schistocerca gregaria]
MGITRDTLHKRRETGGKRKITRKKRKHELGRQPANTHIGPYSVTHLRVRGGNYKHRALRLDHGNFAWASEQCTRKSRLIMVVYNSTSNELVRTNTLVKGAIIQIDAAPFKEWYEKRYSTSIQKVKSNIRFKEISKQASETVKPDATPASSTLDKHQLDPAISAQLSSGRIMARITSRPGQIGRVDGYILEGEELAFYTRKLAERKKLTKH